MWIYLSLITKEKKREKLQFLGCWKKNVNFPKLPDCKHTHKKNQWKVYFKTIQYKIHCIEKKIVIGLKNNK